MTSHDAQTGKEIYGKVRIDPTAGAFTASPWAYNGRIFALSEDGVTFVIQAGTEYRLLGKNSLDEMTLATPAIARGSLFIGPLHDCIVSASTRRLRNETSCYRCGDCALHERGVGAAAIRSAAQGWALIDPRNDINRRMDVAITAGKMARVADTIPAGDARRVVDVSGMFVSQAWWNSCPPQRRRRAGGVWGDRSLPPDGFTFRSGVTTVVDLGSSGWRSFADFKTRVIDRARTRVLAMLNIVGRGMAAARNRAEHGGHGPGGDGQSRPPVPGHHRRHQDGAFPRARVDGGGRAVAAGTAANIPVMVDFGDFSPERPFEELVTKTSASGRHATHMYLQRVPS